ncbi:MAG: competence protein [Rhodobacteraceae bacterium PARR1]|nr:MAG: competence protein [Rhodobacteraceae bacterium PARR1]
MRVLNGLGRWLTTGLADARGHLFPFVPVLIGIGIGTWFALPWEPGIAVYAVLAVAAAGLALSAARWGGAARPLLIGLTCLLLGPLAGGFRAHSVAAPMLDFRYFGPVQGRIIEIDRSQTDALRLTLDRVVLERTDPARTPATVRVSLRGEQRWLSPAPGQTVLMTAHLAAPEGPVEPGGFDFRRMAFFDRLGAVGYTTTPVVLWAEPGPRDQIIARIRTHLTAGIMAAIPGDPGAFAAGVMTGDRSGLSLQAVQDLRDSSLAHLLAISGMNLAFLISFTFAALRGGLALIPPVALRVNGKKLAAAISLPIAGFYLLLSGSNVATERAFVMVAVMLGAVLLDRAAITLRSVAIAALVLLLWQPEALLEPGFQMSFAATIALVAGFEALAKRVERKRLWRGVPVVMTLVLSSVIGGFATAPYAAAHFNRFTDYGLLANLLTVPVMGAVVMPAGAVAAILAPFGLAYPALWVMGQGAAWILWVAAKIAALEGAVTPIPMPSDTVLPMITLGALWLILWPFRARWVGVVPVVAAFWLWSQHERPLLLIDAEARVLGVMGSDGRAINREKGGGFTVQNWMENDGDLSDQAAGFARPGFVKTDAGLRFALRPWRGLVLVKGQRPDCAGADVVIIPAAVEEDLGEAPELRCRVIGHEVLQATGPLAILSDGSLRPTFLAQRLWTPQGAGGILPPPLQ